jgi:hypothetical protein
VPRIHVDDTESIFTERMSVRIDPESVDIDLRSIIIDLDPSI